MAAKGKPTKSFLEHLDEREGNIDKSYLDSLGKLTGGIGHLLLEDEKFIAYGTNEFTNLKSKTLVMSILIIS